MGLTTDLGYVVSVFFPTFLRALPFQILYSAD